MQHRVDSSQFGPTRRALCATVACLLCACQGAIADPANSGPGVSGGSGSPDAGSPSVAGGGPGLGVGGGTGNGATGGSATGLGGAASAGASSGSGGSAGSTTAGCADIGVKQVGRTRLRRLTRSQFNHTVRDLLGATGTPADSVAPDERIGPFYSNAIVPITDLLVQQHAEVATQLAAAAVPRMNQLAPCDLNVGGACPSQFIEQFGLKAYRRPLLSAEREAYLSLYTLERGQGSAASAFQAVVETMLQSPFFLYHADVGGSGLPLDEPVALTSYELASRLSYFLWDTMPDAPLFALAAADTLKDDAVLGMQVERMLADPRAADAIPEFHLQWLGIGDLDGVDKDPQRFPQFNAAMVEAMRAETAAFTDFVVRRGDGAMSTLFTADFSFPRGPLFALYGLTQPAGFTPGDSVPWNPAQRAGLLTQAAFLAKHAHRDQTSPVHRGILVRENILCQPLSPPPANVNNVAPAVTPTTTTRQRFEQHEADPACAGCHSLIDPIGLGFENYDPIGAYRTMDGSFPVDASGALTGAGDNVAGPFVGAVELSRKLANSQQVRDCLANQWFRFALGRMESTDDTCTMRKIHDTFAASTGNVRQLLITIVKSDAFLLVRSAGKGQ